MLQLVLVLVFCNVHSAADCTTRERAADSISACLSAAAAQATAAELQAHDLNISSENWRLAKWSCRIGVEQKES